MNNIDKLQKTAKEELLINKDIKFNVIIFNFNAKKFEYYNIFPYFIRKYKEENLNLSTFVIKFNTDIQLLANFKTTMSFNFLDNLHL